MFIPPADFKRTNDPGTAAGSKVYLRSAHLIIETPLAAEVFGGEQNAYVVYYPQRRTLMMAPVSDELFKNLHKASQLMLKDRNLKGDKSVALHEMLIDHQIDDADRDLEFDFPPRLGILSVKF